MSFILLRIPSHLLRSALPFRDGNHGACHLETLRNLQRHSYNLILGHVMARSTCIKVTFKKTYRFPVFKIKKIGMRFNKYLFHQNNISCLFFQIQFTFTKKTQWIKCMYVKTFWFTYTVKKFNDFSVPSRDVTYQTLVSDIPAGDGKPITFFYSVCHVYPNTSW